MGVDLEFVAANHVDAVLPNPAGAISPGNGGTPTSAANPAGPPPAEWVNELFTNGAGTYLPSSGNVPATPDGAADTASATGGTGGGDSPPRTTGAGDQPPGGTSGGTGQPTAPQPNSYVGDLFHITKSTHTMEGHLEHPDLPGLSAAAAHNGPDVELKPRDYGTDQNSRQRPGTVETYHPDRPVISYRTDMPTEGLVRVWGPETPIADPDLKPPREAGAWATRASDVQHADGRFVSGVEAKDILATPYADPPTNVSTVQPTVGTLTEASKPISDKARQYRFIQWTQSWFQNKKTLG